jgi:MoaA/NifB/PqqE/SkfB family radical SAM enzyme
VEPERQVEIQLGHMCNNRCVFCVSGQRTAMREAFPLPAAPVLERLREARALGITKVTLLGGEPTLQPEFMDVMRGAVALGFKEIVLFTNGVKTARDSFIAEVLDTGGDITWRLSFQGATLLSHEKTTKKLGSFGRLKDTLANLHRRGQRVTVNMCVVQSNYASVSAFPALLLPFGVRQLHLDMMRPLDAGVRTYDELRETRPRYPDMVPALTAMIEGFEAAAPGFDVNIGNLPYCVAPALAPWIHHDGETTFTVSVNDQDALSAPEDKYRTKRRDKVKHARCAQCVFDAQCSGFFDTYERFYGLDALQPVTRDDLVRLDPRQRLFALHAKPFADAAGRWDPPAPFARAAVFTNSRDGFVELRFGSPGGAHARVELRRGGPGAGGVAATDRWSLHLVAAHDGKAAVTLLRALFAMLCAVEPVTVVHPPGDDATLQASLTSHVDRRIGACLGRLRARAPFGELAWRDATVTDDGRDAAVTFDTRDGNAVTVSLAVKGAQVAGGYSLAKPVAKPSASLVASVRSVMEALRAPG